jgi:hypothetical protein
MTTGLDQRKLWLDWLERLSLPLYSHLAAGNLGKVLPVARGQNSARSVFAPLEALGRSLAGIGPWLQCEGLGGEEQEQQASLVALVKASLGQASDPASPDFMNFSQGQQPLVDAAFLAMGLMRSEKTVWRKLDARVQKNIINALKETRVFKPGFNNWLLFSAMVETFLYSIGEEWDRMRVDYALRQHEQWYLGDGAYGDGPFHHWDYYNSFVIQPMLLEILDRVADGDEQWKQLKEPMGRRAVRYAAVQERLIASDGTFPPLGRSLAYRSGAFQHLALMALRKDLPEEISPAQVRCALTAMMKRTLEAPGTFDAKGWLSIGLAGDQPSLAEGYISTGSLYLCACSLLPLGLPPDHGFWTGPDQDWTAKKIWSGQDHPADHALHD